MCTWNCFPNHTSERTCMEWNQPRRPSTSVAAAEPGEKDLRLLNPRRFYRKPRWQKCVWRGLVSVLLDFSLALIQSYLWPSFSSLLKWKSLFFILKQYTFFFLVYRFTVKTALSLRRNLQCVLCTYLWKCVHKRLWGHMCCWRPQSSGGHLPQSLHVLVRDRVTQWILNSLNSAILAGQ